ncbi:MAG: translation elongation factor Ts [Phycisphaerae bacterium]|nr:translation elongation factor Ts [Phycisphaerae bacterium]
MAEITASMVKELRDATSLGMMDCKKALDETAGDIDAAKDLLRAKGMATAEKKAGRATKEGLVAIKIADDKKTAAMVEIQCETDFCARNDEFIGMVNGIRDLAYDAEVGEIAASDAITSRMHDAQGKIGENMSYSRGVKISAAKIGTYIHHNNKVGVIVGVDGDVDEETLTGLCQHIAFSNPMGITTDDIDKDLVAKETEIAKQQAIESGKPEEIAEKMVGGKIKKFLAQNALMEQAYVKDDKKTIKEILGGKTVTAFARYAVGDTGE